MSFFYFDMCVGVCVRGGEGFELLVGVKMVFRVWIIDVVKLSFVIVVVNFLILYRERRLSVNYKRILLSYF